MSRLERPKSIGLAAILASAAVVAVAYALGDVAFRQAFMPGALATFLGITAGLPIALWIDSQRAAAATEAAEGVRQRRVNEFLDVAEADLGRAADELRRGIAGGSARTNDVLPFLQGNLWEAVTASGDVALIGDATVLRALADAYYGIATTAYLERHVWELRTGIVRPDPMATPLGVTPPRPRLDLAEQSSGGRTSRRCEQSTPPCSRSPPCGRRVCQHDHDSGGDAGTETTSFWARAESRFGHAGPGKSRSISRSMRSIVELRAAPGGESPCQPNRKLARSSGAIIASSTTWVARWRPVGSDVRPNVGCRPGGVAPIWRNDPHRAYNSAWAVPE